MTNGAMHSVPPLPGGPEEKARREEAHLRRRVITGKWLPVLQERIEEHFGRIRSQMLGRPTLSRNLARSVALKVSRLYDNTPNAAPSEEEGPVNEEAADALLDLVADAGLWEMGQRHQQHTVLIREGVRRVDAVGDSNSRRLQLRTIPADHVYIETEPSDPEEPALYIEARRRRYLDKGRSVVGWCWDVFDLRDESEPVFAIVKAVDLDEGEDWTKALQRGDLTEQILGRPASGAAYPYRYSDGSPFIPAEVTHALRTGEMWDPYEWRELIEAGLDVAMAWTFWLHCVKDASWPQRWALNARAVGGATENLPSDVAITRVEPDPTVLLQFTARPGEQVMFGQWQAGADPERMEMAISSFEQATIESLGLGSGEARKVGAQSGYAIDLDQKAVRRLQRQFAPMFAASDSALIGKAAAIANREGLVAGAPEHGWTVTYPALDMTQAEREAAAAEIESLTKAGVSPSPIAIVQSLRQCSRDEAFALYKQWRQDAVDIAALDAELAQSGQVRAANGALTAAMEQALRQAIANMQTAS